jgi:hypothetical protein
MLLLLPVSNEKQGIQPTVDYMINCWCMVDVEIIVVEQYASAEK